MELLYFASELHARNHKNRNLTSQPTKTAQRHPFRISQKFNDGDSVVTLAVRISCVYGLQQKMSEIQGGVRDTM